MTLLLAALLAGTAAALLPGRRAGARLEAVLAPAVRPPRRRPVRTPPAVLAVAAVGGAATAWGAASPVLGVLVTTGVLAARAALRSSRDRRAAGVRREAVTTLVLALVAELRAGAMPSAALVSVSDEGPHGLVAAAAAAARTGQDVPAALVEDAGRPGAEGLRAVAACWQVCAGTGSALVPALGRLARDLRAAQTHRRAVNAALAGPRTSARLLALLPLVGLALGAGLGADPVGLLLRTPAGAALLLGGVALVATGLAWTAALVRRAERGTG